MAARWVFVGGTGRSGTTVVARALTAHTPLQLVPVELRFHVDRGGLLDVACGEVTATAFRSRLLGPWYRRETAMGTRGLHPHVEREVLEHAVERAMEQADDPTVLAAALWREVTAAMFGDGRLLEMSPPNSARADDLERVLGDDAALVDVVRDGRDVAHSLARMKWGPEDPVQGLYWWANRMRAADKARRFCRQPPLVVRMEDLADESMHATQAKRLGDHLALPPDVVLAGFAEFDPKAAHIGRWRRSVGADHEAGIDELYGRIHRELVEDGVVGLPVAPEPG